MCAGIHVPEKGAVAGEKKKVVYGKRQRGKKAKVEGQFSSVY